MNFKEKLLNFSSILPGQELFFHVNLEFSFAFLIPIYLCQKEEKNYGYIYELMSFELCLYTIGDAPWFRTKVLDGMEWKAGRIMHTFTISMA